MFAVKNTKASTWLASVKVIKQKYDILLHILMSGLKVQSLINRLIG